MKDQLQEIWIVKGGVSDPTFWIEATGAHVEAGDVEWQFSDGPPGERGSSADFLSLEDGLRHFAPAIFHFVE
jgi:hypothetical protein